MRSKDIPLEDGDGNKKTKGHENDTWRKNSDGSYSEKGEHYTFARRCFNENKGLKAHVVLLCYMEKKKETINIVENLFAQLLFAYSNFALSSTVSPDITSDGKRYIEHELTIATDIMAKRVFAQITYNIQNQWAGLNTRSCLNSVMSDKTLWITVEIMTNGVSHPIPFASATNIGPFSNWRDGNTVGIAIEWINPVLGGRKFYMQHILRGTNRVPGCMPISGHGTYPWSMAMRLKTFLTYIDSGN